MSDPLDIHNIRIEIENEFANFMRISTSLQQTKDDVANENLLKWWWTFKDVFPGLLPIAKQVHQNPGASTTPERIFSYFGRVWSKERNKLAPESACKLTFALANLKLAAAERQKRKKPSTPTNAKTVISADSSSTSAASAAAAASAAVIDIQDCEDTVTVAVTNRDSQIHEEDEEDSESCIIVLDDDEDDEDDEDADLVELPPGGVAAIDIAAESAQLEDDIRVWIDTSDESS